MDIKVRDSNGALLAEGDSVTLIKDLKLKGSSTVLKRGTVIRGIHLTDNADEIEARTDELERPVLDALGDDVDELLKHLDAWSEAVIAAGSYPKRIKGVYNIGGGPHFGSGLTIDTAAEQYEKKA